MYRNIFKRNDNFIFRRREKISRKSKLVKTLSEHTEELDQFYNQSEKQNKKYKYFIDLELSENIEYTGTECVFTLMPPKKKKITVKIVEENYKKLKNNLF